MRFPLEVRRGLLRTFGSLPFSLWDSRGASNQGKAGKRLRCRSPYEIPITVEKKFKDPFSFSCRSPYEIPPAQNLSFRHETTKLPFSLWDSWKSKLGTWEFSSGLPFSLWDSTYTNFAKSLKQALSCRSPYEIPKLSQGEAKLLSELKLPFSLWDSPAALRSSKNYKSSVAVLLMRFSVIQE